MVHKRFTQHMRIDSIPHKYLLVAAVPGLILLLLSLILKSTVFLFVSLFLLTPVTTYMANAMYLFKFNIMPVAFFGFLLAEIHGLIYGISLLLIPNFFMDLYTKQIDFDTAVTYMLMTAGCVLLSYTQISFFTAGLTMAVAIQIIGSIISLSIGNAPENVFLEYIPVMLSNIFAFLVYTNFLLSNLA